MITDVVEIANPFCIAVSSMDKHIYLYDIVGKSLLGRLIGHHYPIMKLDYSDIFGGYLISGGAEN